MTLASKRCRYAGIEHGSNPAFLTQYATSSPASHYKPASRCNVGFFQHCIASALRQIVNHAQLGNFKLFLPLRLLRLRNPWAKCSWRGPWSDGDIVWSHHPRLREEKLPMGGELGIFWIEMRDVYR